MILPDHITLEVGHLELGESILIKEMKNDKLKFLDPQNAAVVTVRITREAEAPAATTTTTTAAAAPGAAAPAAGAAAPAAAAKKEDKPAAKK